MTIKRATFIALCGNSAVVLLHQIMVWTGFRLYSIVGRLETLIFDLCSFGTIAFFLFTLHRKQS
ncbi:MAG TPA: hypothetical protein DDZ88_12310 [Verrucomicrobiales bacterium]|nr:hypothetical protein [Verrucomicrobiales bacterium]